MRTRHIDRLIRLCFYSLWILLNCWQAYHTELLADEAYYWKYAQDLSWGYFDHPPVVGVLIKYGYYFFSNELGVRILTILSGVVFFFLLEMLTRPRNLLLFYFSIASVGAFHLLGLFALPDMPLLLFCALFLYLYKQYLQQDNWGIAVLLAITTALMLLSKYHGILLIGFTLLAYPAIMKRVSFWGIVAISIGLFLPHVLWQYNNDFPSLKYHLQERSSAGYQLEYTLNYLLSVILMFSPATALVLGWHSLKNKPDNTFERTLRFFLAGTLIFFFLMTFKGRGEANWVAMALIPAIVLGYKHCEQQAWFKKFARNSFFITLIIVIGLRAYMVYDYLPNDKALTLMKSKLHGTKDWATSIAEKAAGKPVAFMNKYQYAAWYEFYTGDTAISLNNRMGRKSQYSIWPDEQQIQGNTVMIVPNYDVGAEEIPTTKGVMQYYYIDNFRSASRVMITPVVQEVYCKANGKANVRFKISHRGEPWDVTGNANMPPTVHAMTFKDGEFFSDKETGLTLSNAMLTDTVTYSAEFPAPEYAGEYELYLDVAVGWLPPGINGEQMTLTVE